MMTKFDLLLLYVQPSYDLVSMIRLDLDWLTQLILVMFSSIKLDEELFALKIKKNEFDGLLRCSLLEDFLLKL